PPPPHARRAPPPLRGPTGPVLRGGPGGGLESPRGRDSMPSFASGLRTPAGSFLLDGLLDVRLEEVDRLARALLEHLAGLLDPRRVAAGPRAQRVRLPDGDLLEEVHEGDLHLDEVRERRLCLLDRAEDEEPDAGAGAETAAEAARSLLFGN